MSLLHPISGCGNAARAADVVFLHGLGGDAFATWRWGKDEAGSWPHQLGREFPQVGVWSLGYAASPSKWLRVFGLFLGRRDAGHAMALPDRALQVLDLMVQRGLGERPLLFICHSLGGLVAKQILRKADDAADPRKNQVARNTRAVLFLATPHRGAVLASLASAFRAVFGATVSIEDLRAHDAHLGDLFDWYRNHAAQLGIETVTYYEQRDVGGLRIVNPTSSHPGVGADPVPLDEDHLSIAKPRSPDAQVSGAARHLLLTYVLAPRSTPTQPSPPAPMPAGQVAAPGAVAAPRRIPHELPPAAEQYFGRQAELARLIERLRLGQHTAVVGPAGLGKTALAAKAVREVVGTSPGTLARSPFPDGVVFLDLYTFRGEAEPAWNTLANKLEGAEFRERTTGRERATEACRARRLLLIIEGGEEADGAEGRPGIRELLSVLSPENRWLLLTRLNTQADSLATVELREALDPDDAGRLLDARTGGRLPAAVRERVLELLDGHPLALTWAGSLLARDEDDPNRLVHDWETDRLPALSDPRQAEHTLEWLFRRSVRGLDGPAQQVLAAAGLLARAPFPLAAAAAALAENGGADAARDPLRALARRGLLRWTGEADHWQFTHVLGYRFARQETGSDPELRERLGQWLHGHLTAALAPNATIDGPLALTRALEHTAALLRTDDDQRLWLPLANFVLYQGKDRLEELGRLALVRLALGAVAGWLERFPADKANESWYTREIASLQHREGDVRRSQGDLPGALAAYQKALAIVQRLAAADPENTGGQRDLSVSHIKVGDVLGAQGNLLGALAAYREALAIAQGLATADPTNTGRQRDLCVHHNKVGDVLRAQGNLPGALEAYREGLDIAHRLAATDSANAEWQRDLSLTHGRIGDVLRAKGDLLGALAAYREDLAITQRLAAADRANAGRQHDLSICHEKMGDVLREQGDLSGSLTAYQEELAIARRLTAADPSNAGWQRILLYAYYQTAEIHEKQAKRAEALRLAEESLAIAERLAALDTTNAIWQHDLTVTRALVARLRG